MLSLVYILALLVKADSQVDCSIKADKFYTVSSKRSCLNYSRDDTTFKQFRNSAILLLPFSVQIQCKNYAQLNCYAQATRSIYDVPLSEFNEIDISGLQIDRIYMPGQKLLNEEKPASTVLINWAKGLSQDQNASLAKVNTVLQQEFWYDTARWQHEYDTMKVYIQGDGNKSVNYYLKSNMSFADVSKISDVDSPKKEEIDQDRRIEIFVLTIVYTFIGLVGISPFIGCCCCWYCWHHPYIETDEQIRQRQQREEKEGHEREQREEEMNAKYREKEQREERKRQERYEELEHQREARIYWEERQERERLEKKIQEDEYQAKIAHYQAYGY
ncbi:MAG: hypothetical protein EZS28_016923 [Streblomastix strix]|uniref:Uncharacterized protein n=1 Tax=Streblomastix strix TaxID=222440 RepID=A0A5J4VZ51_9EUKA|nr:MAG: hypothetical protein EZS28_016923 [Streblomastix strix]